VKATLEVVLSNSLIPFNNLSNKIVVFIDILRNTSVMITALNQGIAQVKPVASVDEAKSYLGKENFIVAGERDAIKIPEFDYGNSPYDYIDNPNIKGKTLVITSTNGTQSVNLAKEADVLVCGGFVNETKVIEYLKENNRPVVLLASGWKGKVNVEDSLCCGMLVEKLKDDFKIENDSALLSQALYNQHKENIVQLIEKTSHYHRVVHQAHKKDVAYCFKNNAAPVLPIYNGSYLTL